MYIFQNVAFFAALLFLPQHPQVDSASLLLLAATHYRQYIDIDCIFYIVFYHCLLFYYVDAFPPEDFLMGGGVEYHH